MKRSLIDFLHSLPLIKQHGAVSVLEIQLVSLPLSLPASGWWARVRGREGERVDGRGEGREMRKGCQNFPRLWGCTSRRLWAARGETYKVEDDIRTKRRAAKAVVRMRRHTPFGTGASQQTTQTQTRYGTRVTRRRNWVCQPAQSEELKSFRSS